jgi:hypothetical protein
MGLFLLSILKMGKNWRKAKKQKLAGRSIIPRWAQIFLFVTVLGSAAFHLTRREGTEGSVRELQAIHRVMEQADSFSDKEGNPPRYRAYTDESGVQRSFGICFLTTDVFPEERGYAGPISVMVGLDTSGKITGVEIVSHRETESYVRPMYEPWFSEQFRGKGIGDEFRLGKDIQGITRASVTSEAIVQSVRKSTRKMASIYLGLHSTDEPEIRKPLPWLDIGIVLLLFVIALFGTVTGKRLYTWASLTGGFAFIGILKSSPLSTVHFLNLIMGNIPPPHEGIFLYILVGASFVSAIFLGRVYCRGICPFGALQELLHHISPLRMTASGTVTKGLDRKELRIIPYLVLWTLVMIVFITHSTKATTVEPYIFLFSFRGNILAWMLVGVVVLWGLFYKRFWCRFFCPVGAVLDLAGRLNPLKKLRKRGRWDVL